MLSSSQYPYNIPAGFSFKVIFPLLFFLDGNECSFQDVSGINVSIVTTDVQEGGVSAVYKLPEKVKYDNLVLKRGLLKGSSLYFWMRNSFSNFDFRPMDIIVNLQDERGIPSVSWMFRKAYPVSLKISEFKAMDNSIVVETLELAYSYFERLDNTLF
ncbi:MAG: phage tail protein [Chitinophagaceae bacterium]|jgi:phage tail-like protein|nr:phage tail protein [Chitinophagaceae bacterium]